MSKLIPLVFKTFCNPHNAGDIAGYKKEIAERLVKSGDAVYYNKEDDPNYQEAKKEVKKEVKKEEVKKEEAPPAPLKRGRGRPPKNSKKR